MKNRGVCHKKVYILVLSILWYRNPSLVDTMKHLIVVFIIFPSHTCTFQLLDKPWSQVSSLPPPPVLAFNFYRA